MRTLEARIKELEDRLNNLTERFDDRMDELENKMLTWSSLIFGIAGAFIGAFIIIKLFKFFGWQ